MSWRLQDVAKGDNRGHVVHGESFMKAILPVVVGMLLVLAAANAQAAADVGLINQLSGEVAYKAPGSSATRASAFMKVREGDNFRLNPGARLRVVYFDGGRQELWEGPAEFNAARKQGSVISGMAMASQLPGGVPQALAQTPELMQIVKVGRPGAVTVRGIKPGMSAEQKLAVQQARDQYKSMSAGAASDDVTPELYMLNVLREHALHDEMKTLAARMLAKQPAQQEVRDIVAWVDSLGATGSGR